MAGRQRAGGGGHGVAGTACMHHAHPLTPPCPPPMCGVQGRQAYLDKRPPDFSRFKRLP